MSTMTEPVDIIEIATRCRAKAFLVRQTTGMMNFSLEAMLAHHRAYVEWTIADRDFDAAVDVMKELTTTI